MKNKTVTTGKMVTAAAAMLVALALIGTATYAWYTISHQTDSSGMGITIKVDESEIPIVISTSKDGEYTNSISLMKAFPDLSKIVLRPISTSDGLHWYLPHNDSSTGDVTSLYFVDRELDDIANRVLTGAAVESASNSALNYLAYADVWIKLRDDDSGKQYALHLNNPSDLDSVKADGEEKYFGSVALCKPSSTSAAVGSSEKYYYLDDEQHNGNDAVSSLRIGLRFYNSGVTEDSTGDSSVFWIYEPAADLRSSYFDSEVKSPTKDMTRKHDVAYTLVSGASIQVASYTAIYAATSNNAIETWLPKYISENEYALVQQSGLNTIRQEHSSWGNFEENKTEYNCTDLASIGSFLTGSAITDETSLVSIVSTSAISMGDTPILTTLQNSTPIKLRIYIWIEGQDVDCWNAVTAGNLFLNLELRGEKIN